MVRALRCRGRWLCVQKNAKNVVPKSTCAEVLLAVTTLFSVAMTCVTIAMCGKSCFFDDTWMENAHRLLLDSNHTPTMWKRYLVQLGTVPVTYKCWAPRGGAVTALAVVDLTKKHCHPDARTTALTQPKSATAHWLKKLGVEPVDMFPPRFFGNERIEVVVRVQMDSLEKVLRGSGEFGVFSRPFIVKGEPRVYKDVLLPDDSDLQAALRKSKSVGPSIHGIVLRGKGFGL